MVNVKLDKFEGPLGLLLKLIEKEELDITQVSLAKIADQYIEYLKKIKNFDPDEMADFLVVAAKLLLIKSRALLPYLYPEEEEEAFDLEEQLKIYKEFLEASKVMAKLIGKKKFMFAREFNKKAILLSVNVFSPPKKITAEDLKAVFDNLIISLKPERELEEEKIEYKISIDEKILAIQNMLLNRIRTSFNAVLDGAKSKAEVIVSFLALLELIKQRSIFVKQGSLFGEIEINKI